MFYFLEMDDFPLAMLFGIKTTELNVLRHFHAVCMWRSLEITEMKIEIHQVVNVALLEFFNFKK